MKQIVFISGKGGTGKTIITASMAALAKNSVLTDCDVDAADLHLLLSPNILKRDEFSGVSIAEINSSICLHCGKCRVFCRFDAIDPDDQVNVISCEGCGLCSYVCPQNAISMIPKINGEWYISETRFGLLVHARLGIAEENSGKLVSLIRKKAKELAEKKQVEWILADGAPGIGCPVIASLSGIDLAIVVTEPTLSGIHDAKRVIEVAKHFKVALAVIINKCDLHEGMTQKIEEFCRQGNIPLIGKIPFDSSIVKSMINGKTAVEAGSEKVRGIMKTIWNRIMDHFSKI